MLVTQAQVFGHILSGVLGPLLGTLANRLLDELVAGCAAGCGCLDSARCAAGCSIRHLADSAAEAADLNAHPLSPRPESGQIWSAPVRELSSETGIEDSRRNHNSRRVRRSLELLRSDRSARALRLPLIMTPKSPYMLED